MADDRAAQMMLELDRRVSVIESDSVHHERRTAKLEDRADKRDADMASILSLINGIDRKIDIQIASQRGSDTTSDKVLKYLIPFILIAIGAFWGYNQYLEAKLPKVQTESSHSL